MTTTQATHDARSFSSATAERASWRQTLQNALVITRREVRDSLRDWRIMVPIFLLTLIFPLLATAMTRIFTGFFEDNGAEDLLPALLPLMPMVVGFFPVSISLVIALETFVGEKERRSLEPLLSTPLTNTELYMGKTLAAMIPPLLASYTGIAIYVGSLVLGKQQWRPEPVLIVQILLLTTFQALVMVTGAVVVSSQTTSTRAANLLASFIIIPMSMLMILESTIMVKPYKRYLLWYIMVGMVVTVILLVRMGARIFNREELLGRALDQLNLRWSWHIFWDELRGPVGERFHLGRWYRLSVWPTVRSLRTPTLVVLLVLMAAFAVGWLYADQWRVPLEQFQADDEQMLDNLRSWLALGQKNPHLILFALTQNLRVLAVATLLAIFTFGVMALVIVAAPFGILGFVLAQVVHSGLSPMPFMLGVLPHGVVEVPAIVLAAAAALRLGSVVTRPPQDMTVSEAWLRALGDAVKVGLGVVLPLLVLAAVLEVIVTPRVVQWALGL